MFSLAKLILKVFLWIKIDIYKKLVNIKIMANLIKILCLSCNLDILVLHE